MRFLRLLLVLSILVLLFASQGARFLTVDDPQKSDVIVVLAGDTIVRPARGLELLRQGMAPRLFFDAETGRIYNSHLTDIAQQYIQDQPDAAKLAVCGITGHSTFAETTDVERCIEPFHPHRVLLVTSDYHTRRALSIFSHRLPQYQWSVAAAHNPAQFGNNWWADREWAKVAFDEWMKLIWWEAVDRWK
ncbi:MAG TPA: YdcF family protein [Terriglobales bacterium]|nr:YdcF family protein [Terriglobales bacterium]